MAVIVIDPGHGGHDPGALGARSKEKDNVLKVALRMKGILEKHGHKVILTRSTDKYLTLSERAKIANNHKADIFVSLHDNSAVNKSATGFETFIYNKTSNNNTIKLQKEVHDAIAKKIGIRNRGKKKANFAVVRETRMPAVLIEYAFISNYNDETILIKKVEELAKWTCEGILKYFGQTLKYNSTSKTATTKKSSGAKNNTKKSTTTNKTNKSTNSSIKVGSKVLLKTSAQRYATGQSIPSRYKGKVYTVQQVKTDRVLLKELYSWVKRSDVSLNTSSSSSNKSSTSTKKAFKVGDKVRIKSSAKYYSRTKNIPIPSKYKNKSYTIQQVGKDDVLIKELYSWVKKSDLE